MFLLCLSLWPATQKSRWNKTSYKFLYTVSQWDRSTWSYPGFLVKTILYCNCKLTEDLWRRLTFLKVSFIFIRIVLKFFKLIFPIKLEYINKYNTYILSLSNGMQSDLNLIGISLSSFNVQGIRYNNTDRYAKICLLFMTMHILLYIQYVFTIAI